ncbi:hypothetical protein BOTBODRAFT_65585 [Botryobasidium botryosum FD-172 SS1]|uniref:F-box domain-containing protein n=1 Tax=Botryobasidium botryosum (strain FD-172 SS1) TaxID=930990 RepID=A0A067MHD6_BOTB1|nr:hypothetical protein BOTBODRAFT_65585 [Botryobasidium botryosum FD-172 SS1]
MEEYVELACEGGSEIAAKSPVHAINLIPRDLPPEILSSIFLFVPAGESWTFTPLVPIRLSSVCHYWRDAAINTGTLWSTITFFGRHRFHIAELFLSRAQRCTLDIVLFDGWDKESELQMAKAVELVLPALPRWRALAIDLRDLTGALPTLALILAHCRTEPAMVPRLHSLILAAVGDVVRTDDIDVVQTCVETLRPASLSFCGVLPDTRIPYENTKYLTLRCLRGGAGGLQIGRLQGVLQSCTRLESLTLYHAMRETGNANPVPLILPALKEFFLSGGSVTTAKLVLTSMDAPSLRSFKIRFHIHKVQNELEIFLRRHGPSIREFYINKFTPHTIKFLYAIPNLETLGFIGASADTSLGELVAHLRFPGLDVVFPRFSVFDIIATRLRAAAVDSLKEIVELAPLRSLSVRAGSGYATEEEQARDRDWFCARVEVAAWNLCYNEVDPRTRCFEDSTIKNHAYIS